MHHRTIQINHQPDATFFQFIILTFVYSSTCVCTWSGRPARPRIQHDHHHDMKVKPQAATAGIELQMMGGKTPETCWAVNKSQDNKHKKFLHLVGDLFKFLSVLISHLLENVAYRYFILKQSKIFLLDRSRSIFQTEIRLCHQTECKKNYRTAICLYFILYKRNIPQKSVIFLEDSLSHIISCSVLVRFYNCSFVEVCYGE